jgi:Peptidase family S41
MARGARTWSARSITAIRALGLALTLLLATPAAADDALDRILAETAAASGAPLPSRGELTEACGSDLHCSAERLVEVLGPRARLLPVAHPDSDTIRWVETQPSLSVTRADGVVRIALSRFGRKVMPELAAAVGAEAYVLDLRAAQGGRFERMLQVAGFLLGPREKALALVEGGGRRWLDLPATAERGRRPRVVQIGAATASAAEVLAALLVADGGAVLCGAGPSAGAAALKAVVPVNHDWRLLVERARIEVPPVELRGGLRPQRAC